MAALGSSSNSQLLQHQINHNSKSPSPQHFNSSLVVNSNQNNNNVNNSSSNNNNQSGGGAGGGYQQNAYLTQSSPKHNHHQNLVSPVNYMGSSSFVPAGASGGGGGGGGGMITGGASMIAALGSDSGSNSNMSYPPNFVNFVTANTVTPTVVPSIKVTKCVQTEITTNQMLDSASAIETKNTRIDELLKEKDELGKELMTLRRDYDKQVLNFKKCLGVNKKLLIEKVSRSEVGWSVRHLGGPFNDGLLSRCSSRRWRRSKRAKSAWRTD